MYHFHSGSRMVPKKIMYTNYDTNIWRFLLKMGNFAIPFMVSSRIVWQVKEPSLLKAVSAQHRSKFAALLPVMVTAVAR
jgi:hypothetical protein